MSAPVFACGVHRRCLEHDKAGGAETPRPATLAVGLVAGLIGIELSLLGPQGDQLSIGRAV
jgi:hypothetical protein